MKKQILLLVAAALLVVAPAVQATQISSVAQGDRRLATEWAQVAELIDRAPIMGEVDHDACGLHVAYQTARAASYHVKENGTQPTASEVWSARGTFARALGREITRRVRSGEYLPQSCSAKEYPIPGARSGLDVTNPESAVKELRALIRESQNTFSGDDHSLLNPYEQRKAIVVHIHSRLQPTIVRWLKTDSADAAGIISGDINLYGLNAQEVGLSRSEFRKLAAQAGHDYLVVK